MTPTCACSHPRDLHAGTTGCARRDCDCRLFTMDDLDAIVRVIA